MTPKQLSALVDLQRQNESLDIYLRRQRRQLDNLLAQFDTAFINNKQHLIVIGSAADDKLINPIDYWKHQGISIEFLPYRIYELEGEKYFEFFASPYDRHKNPGEIKGILFDANRSWDEEPIWYMMENSRVAAFGNAKRFVEYVYPGGIVFFSHKWVGLVAAGRVKKGIIKSPDEDTLYREVEFITPVPKRNEPILFMPFAEVSKITGKSFFGARTIKVLYLSRDEAENLAQELKVHFEKGVEP